MTGTMARAIAGIPVVASTAERDVLYPLPARDQRVQIRSTEAVQRYDGTQWVTSIPGALGNVVDVTALGAVGDGVVDDTPAFLAALATGRDIYVPPTTVHYRVTQALSLTAAGQGVYGEGLLSKVVQEGTNADASVFQAIGLGQNEFRGLNVVPNTTTSSTYYGYGFYVSGSAGSVVADCRVSAHRRGGIGIFESDACKVVDNWIEDSVVAPGVGVSANNSGADIYVSDSSDCVVAGNHCLNGAGFGIAFQTLTSGSAMRRNAVIGNVIRDQDLYGILVYKLNAPDTVEHFLIQGNQIDTVTGSIPEAGGQYNYGAGIYLQTVDHVVVIGNSVKATNSGHAPDLQQVPAAIAISGCHNVTVTGNEIEDAYYWGIAAVQATAYTSNGRGLLIADNRVRMKTGVSAQSGIYVLDVVGAVIHDNRIYGDGPSGIRVRQATLTQSEDFDVHHNRVQGFAIGVDTEGTLERMLIQSNTIRGNTGYALVLRAAVTICAQNLITQGSGGDGILVASTCADGFCIHNYITGGDNGILDDGGGTLLVDQNIIRSVTNPYNGGVSSSFYRLLANSATPSVKCGRWFNNANTTAITNFTNGHEGQEITLRASASFTVTQGSTIKLAGAVDFAMTATDILTLVLRSGVWEEASRSVN